MERWILIILIVAQGVWSGDWEVNFENQCALKGTSVILKCMYDYPFGHLVTSVSWSKALHIYNSWRLIPVDQLPSPPDHFRYIGNYRGDCSLQVNEVQSTDEGAYYFSFVTTFNRWRSKKYAYLSVAELTAVVQPNTVTEGDTVRLTCVSGCPEPTQTVWIRDGQRVSSSDFQARREDAGRYYCAILGQEMVRSASVILNVYYAPKQVTLSVSPSKDIIKGGTVTFTCTSDANPPVTTSGYSLYKEGEFISSGQDHVISDIEPSHSGWYHCQAWNSISWRGNNLFNSSVIQLDVQYPPMNVSISMDPGYIVEGSSVNLTCSSAANPAADNYTWYKRTESLSSSSLVQVGSGPMLTLASVEEARAGLYLCYVKNSLGENNSTEMMLVIEKKQGIQSLPVLAGIGVCLFVTLVIALLLFWTKQRSANKNETGVDVRLSGGVSRSEKPPEAVYDNVLMFPSSSPPVSAKAAASDPQRNLPCDASNQDEVTYSTVTFIPRNLSSPRHTNNSKESRDSWSKSGEDETSVVYATVVKSS